MTLEPDACYRALLARDPRFDGLFFVAVSTTGIYCRPVCRARTPGRDRCTFFPSTVLAERAGFRACMRCRPELAPGAAPLDSLSRLVAAAVGRIDAGALNEGSLEALAGALGVTGRHLRRAMHAELGISPVELAQTRRLAVAKQLLHDTWLPITEVAYASGYKSLRRFNTAFRAAFARPPSALRAGRAVTRSETIALTLDYRPPLDWDALVAFLAKRAIPGVEAVHDGAYVRTVQLGAHRGFVRVAPVAGRDALRAEVSLSLRGVILPLVARLRRLFDLDARPDVIAAHLARDARLAPLVRSHPGVRVPGAFDGLEMAARAVLGQQVSVAAATTLAGRLAAHLGAPLETPHAALTRVFPTAAQLAAAPEADLARLGILATRCATLRALAALAARAPGALEPTPSPEAAMSELTALPGVGDWTAQYIAMRALRWPDAFPAGDLGVRKALGGLSARAATAAAEPWRPWRAYAVMLLWQGGA